jgi:predicted transposase/invertase (TIGR01784 family)
MKPGIDPKVDYAFKRLFGSEPNIPILSHLVESVLKPPPDQQLVELKITNPFNDKESADDKLSILDIKARDRQGNLYNIEMQMYGLAVFLHRVLYYWAVVHGGQLIEGDSYSKLRKTISIIFVNSTLFPQVPDYHLAFQLRSSQHSELIFSDHQVIHLIELPKFQLKVEELTEPLELWCYFLKHAASLDKDSLPEALRIPAVRQAMEVLSMLSQSEIERDRYEARLKYERDQMARTEEAHEKGREKGLLEGREKGLLEGREKMQREVFVQRIQFCQRLLKVTVTPQEELLALTNVELEAKAKDLEKLLGVSDES